MQSGIYKIVNLVTAKIYVGSAITISSRWRTHKSHLNRNVHDNSYLQNAWNKYSQFNFEFIVLENCEKDKLIEREQFYLDTLKPEYNICPKAGNQLGLKFSDASKIKMSLAQQKRFLNKQECLKVTKHLKGNTYKRGTKTSDATKVLMSKASKNKPKSLQHAIAISLAHTGRKKSPEHIAAIWASRKRNKLLRESI